MPAAVPSSFATAHAADLLKGIPDCFIGKKAKPNRQDEAAISGVSATI
jgi:hypothetical protein